MCLDTIASALSSLLGIGPRISAVRREWKIRSNSPYHVLQGVNLRMEFIDVFYLILSEDKRIVIPD